MNLLALEPYFGGSHRAFLEGWRGHSRHRWTLLTLPPYKWKWRMRHSAATLAQEAALRAGGARWDLLLCSDMLNLAEFRGLAPESVRSLPAVAYFHENQLTYPVRHEDERDYHFALTNLVTALAADRVWFNSAFHRDDFLSALPRFLRRMPDHQPFEAVAQIRRRSEVHPPGIEAFPPRGPRPDGPLHVLWAARWEHDKAPEDFFEALRRVKARGTPFRLSVLGHRFREAPPVFAWAEEHFRKEIVHWGPLDAREAYRRALAEGDLFVSTARHEFFGIAAVEAIAAGCRPLLPRRLAYPEILRLPEQPEAEAFFYDGSAADLADRLARFCGGGRDALWTPALRSAAAVVRRFRWDLLAPELDRAAEAAAGGGSGPSG